MADEEKKQAAAEVTGEGVKVAVGVGEWILFPLTGFTVDDEIYLSNISYANAFAFIVERCLDWKVTDLEGAIVPFNREALTRGIQAARMGIRGQLPKIPVQKEPAFIDAIWTALREIRKLPL